MRRPAFLAATAVTALLGLYIALVAGRALVLIRDDAWMAKALGLLFFVLPVIAVWYLVNEWRLSMTVQRMATRLEREGRLPIHDGEQSPSGRLSEQAAADVYEVARHGVELEPEDWAAWFHLAFAYDAAKERGEARRALRYAAQLFRRDSASA